jgi:hypothetical protein
MPRRQKRPQFLHVTVIAYRFWRKSSLYRFISVLCLVQILIGVWFSYFHSALRAHVASENDVGEEG